LKKLISKADVRVEINRQVDDFIDTGGAVTSVERGLSGREDHQSASRSLFDQPKATRTYIPEVTAAIDSRKAAKASKESSPKKTRQLRKKIIYDDFGEALREVWVES
jgi:hypothetical protein